MSFPIRVLLVQREHAAARELETACLNAVEGKIAVTAAADPGAASAELAAGEFDLVVQDLSSGLDLFRSLARDHPGVPVVVLSEDGDPRVVNELLAAARQEDLYGTETERPMVSFYRLEGAECIDGLQSALRSAAEVASLAIELQPPLELSTSERRTIQIFVRRTGAARAEVTGLSGGLSGARTVVVDAADASGMKTAHVVGKLTTVESIPGAVDGYENATPSLPAGLGAALAGVVSAGAGNTGGVFFRLADDYRRTWFDCLAASPADAAEAVRGLHERFADEYPGAPVERETVGEIRRGVVTDAEMAEFASAAPSLEPLEGIEVDARRGIQHRDLHGLNVLVSDSSAPLLIDYDNFAPANAAVDPVTLELSAIFHRDERAQGARRGWPAPEQARGWADLDAYLEGCPYAEAIRACRAWAEDAAASPGELWATLLAVSFRQFWFENTDKLLAAALLETAGAELE